MLCLSLALISNSVVFCRLSLSASFFFARLSQSLFLARVRSLCMCLSVGRYMHKLLHNFTRTVLTQPTSSTCSFEAQTYEHPLCYLHIRRNKQTARKKSALFSLFLCESVCDFVQQIQCDTFICKRTNSN